MLQVRLIIQGFQGGKLNSNGQFDNSVPAPPPLIAPYLLAPLPVPAHIMLYMYYWLCSTVSHGCMSEGPAPKCPK
jgi:hypothetical protein